MTAPRYPRVRTLLTDHTQVEVTYADDAEPVTGCGETWCRGDCGLPAIVVPADGERDETKMRSSMVAHGPVMQPWCVAWTGTKVEVPAEHRADFLRRVWI